MTDEGRKKLKVKVIVCVVNFENLCSFVGQELENVRQDQYVHY